MCSITNLINQRASDNYNRIKTMKTRKAFNEAYPQLTARQQSSAYMLSQIDGWSITIDEPTYKVTLTKDGKVLTLHENGNAL
jgi:hypothetical protein